MKHIRARLAGFVSILLLLSTLGAEAQTQCTLANSVGFVGNGSTANDTAFSTWWASLPPEGGCLEFGVGKYKFAVAVSETMASALQSVTIRGLGSDLTILYFPNAGGLEVTQGSFQNSIHIRDLTITTGSVGLSNGLWLNSASPLAAAVQSDITNVQIRGDDWDDHFANSFYWGTGLNILGWSNLVVQNVNTYGKIPGAAGGGTGVQLGGTADMKPLIVVSFYNSNFVGHVYGVKLNSNWEGISFVTCNWQVGLGSVGLWVPPSQTHTGPLLTVLNSQFNNGGEQIDFNSPVSQFIMTGSTLTISDSDHYGLVMNGGNNAIITGNHFDVSNTEFTNTTAIYDSGTNGSIVGNIFIGQTTAINIAGSNITVGPNTYQFVGTKVVNTGTGNTIIDFGSGGVVAYETTGAWIPTDQSGAGLTFTDGTAACDMSAHICGKLFRTGNWVHAYGSFTFPSTASTATALVGGLPVGVPNLAYAAIPGSVKVNIGGTTGDVVALPVKGTSNFNLWSNGTPGNIQNAWASGVTVNFNISYPAN